MTIISGQSGQSRKNGLALGAGGDVAAFAVASDSAEKACKGIHIK
jgi:hypothetical protein